MSEGERISVGKMQTNFKLFLKYVGKNLTDKSRRVLLNLSTKKYKSEDGSKWRFSISEADPIKFNVGQPKIADKLHPEFFGHIAGPGEKWALSDYSICFRVWSSNKNHTYWPPTDSDLARKSFLEDDKQRLILRLRFDLHEKLKGSSISHHPWFHMQIGGESKIEHIDPREKAPVGHYRYPPSIDIPRIPSFPMSFILMGRFILANYHPRDYNTLCSQNHRWKSMIAREEKWMWGKFMEEIKCQVTTDLKLESCFDRIGMYSKLGWR